ncbi:MAG TPA: 16S rRNA (guanine(527)-N(7))-methyltransferase RsmG [Candidatus Dormibacteraeota bacterium]|nr:16S rRNA (guanine(527)-N(7))-methyltransferase RsmG [Candidatus Dormibacteraeota bacterium]
MNEILFNLISSWPGLVARPDRALIDDSLVLLDFLPPGPLRVIDVGSGGGLPGLPLKIARPELRLTLLEANRRKAAFLVQAAARLGLDGVEVVAERAETAGHDPRYREAFDFALARAVAAMPVLAELCLPLVAVGGRLLAMKTAATAEAAAAEAAIRRLGGELLGVGAAASEARSLGEVVVVAKVAPTPTEFPRRPGLPGRRPLAG